MANVLIVDDDNLMCEVLQAHVRKQGHDAEHVPTLAQGLTLARERDFDVVFLDVNMPDGTGLEALPRFQGQPSSPEVIIITGVGDSAGAEIAIKSGAWDYVQKGASVKDMVLPLLRALQYRRERLNYTQKEDMKRCGIVGSHPSLQACLNQVAQVASSGISVLLTGETGTGKELFARAIHENSPRVSGPFVVVDCAALPETLVESVLFGHVRGAFTGADRAQDGLLLAADGGTLFLDEVGELPLGLQKDFLRALQEKRFRPVGAGQEAHSNFRLVAATNRDLESMVASGEFRKDLLFRIRAFAIHLPSLRQRKKDIEELTALHMAGLCRRSGVEPKEISSDFMEALTEYAWPGNVRELINTLDEALAKAGDAPTMFQRHLPDAIRLSFAQTRLPQDQPPARPASVSFAHLTNLPSLETAMKEYSELIEAAYFHELYARTNGDMSETMRISGLARSTIYARLRKHGLINRR